MTRLRPDHRAPDAAPAAQVGIYNKSAGPQGRLIHIVRLCSSEDYSSPQEVQVMRNSYLPMVVLPVISSQ